MTDSLIITSFSNGELSPSVFGREDLPKIRAGAALMRNFFVDYRGGASTRAGTKTIGQAFKSAGNVRVIKFQFSIEQTYVLEFGDHYMRVITNEGLVLASPSAGMADANGNVWGVANSWAVGDWVWHDGLQEIFAINSRTSTSITVLHPNGMPVTGFVPAGNVSRIYVVATPWGEGDLPGLKFTQSNDVLTVTHIGYPPYDINRLANDNWQLVGFNCSTWNTGPITDNMTTQPVTAPSAGSSSHDAYYEYVVTAVSGGGEEGLPSGTMGTYYYNMGIDNGTIIVRWHPVPGASLYNIYRAASYNDTPVPAGALHGYVGSTTGSSFTDSNIVPSFVKTPPVHRDPFAPGQVLAVATTAAGSGYTNPTWTMSDPTGTDFFGRLVVAGNGSISGFTITNPGKGYTNPVFTISDPTGSGATFSVSVTPNSGTWPSVAGYFQQRRVFAASLNYPETLWGSKPGTVNNFDTANPVVDSDAFTFTLSSYQVNNIKWMISMPGGLVVFTGSGVWQLSGAGQNVALTPSNAFANPQAYTGCADVPPIAINYSLIYVQQKGSVVRDLSYNFYANIYTGLDTTVLSNHLFYGYQIVDWAYAEEPYKVIWAARSDGKLLSLTYLKEQEVIGWSLHESQGNFLSVATISRNTGKEDSAYFVVERVSNGQLLKFIEVMEDRDYSTGNDSPWCVDAGVEILDGQRTSAATLSAASGTARLNAPAETFDALVVGKVLRFGGGRGTVTGFLGPNDLVVELDQAVMDVLATGLPRKQSLWAISTKRTTVTGLSHLEGQNVVGLADGLPFGPNLVTNGQITLAWQASRIIVGLGFTAKLQTMYAEGGNQTIQGHRKEIDAVTTRVNETRGLKVGASFDTLEDLTAAWEVSDNPIALRMGDYRKPVHKDWSLFGQVCFQQSLPLPATVLAVIYEINIGN